MKKLKEIAINIDERVDKMVNPIWKHIKKYFPIFSATVLSLLVLFFIYRVFREKPYFSASVISSDIEKIVRVLNEIDKECNILRIENVKNYVDFLTVEKFTGSEVGCLNLAYPKNWRGPYLQDNPTYQGKLYEIIKTKNGVFVVPGWGVKLPNKLKLGEDFKLSYDSDIAKMLENGGKLNYSGQVLGLQLKFKIGDWDKPKLSKEEIDELSAALKEFNEAMPFTQNKTNPYSC